MHIHTRVLNANARHNTFDDDRFVYRFEYFLGKYSHTRLSEILIIIENNAWRHNA